MNKFEKRNQTKERRKTLKCRTFTIKIDKSKLSIQSKNHLNLLFKEAKWFYNHCLSFDNINNVDCKVKSVHVKVKDNFEIRNFNYLQAQHKQSIRDNIISSIKSLSTKKKKGHKIGKLKFKKELNLILLRKFGIGEDFDINFKKNTIRINGFKRKWLKVNGLDQIPQTSEIANAQLIKKCNDYYLNVVTFENKKEIEIPNESVGIDFGCESQLAFSNGIKIKYEVPISKKLKKIDKKLSKRSKNSKKKEQLKIKRRKEYLYLTNKKKDVRNKITNCITKNYKYVIFQDENIKGWQSSNHGKKIQFSAIGGLISDLKIKSHTPIIIDKFFPSTQLCPVCSIKKKLSLDERTYMCNSCGYTNDRDVKSAICIENEGMKNIPMDHRDLKAREKSTSVFFNSLILINGIKVNKLISMN